MKNKEIREMDESGLIARLAEKRRELLNLNLRRRMDRVEKSHQFSQLRREIAQILTILRENKIRQEQAV